MIPDPETVAAGITTVSKIAAGKKFTMGVLAMAGSELKSTVSLTNLIIGTVIGLVTGTIILTVYGQDIKHQAAGAYSIAGGNSERIREVKEKIEDVEQVHASQMLASEKRLGKIESDVKIIRYQSQEILRVLQRQGDRSQP